MEWLKNNITQTITLIIVIGGLITTNIKTHSDVEHRIEKVESIIEDRKVNVDKQKELNTRLLLAETQLRALELKVDNQSKALVQLSSQTNEIKTQGAIVNSTVANLDKTLSKMNTTLDKLNSTVAVIKNDVDNIKER